MKKYFLLLSFVGSLSLSAQPPVNPNIPEFYQIQKVKATPVKNQQNTGTCWCFSTTSLLESEEIRKENKEIDLSEMYTVRSIYIDKAKNYVLRQGHAQFGEGGLGHDMINAAARYGAIPQSAYTGLVNGATTYDHQKLVRSLQEYLDGVLKKQPVPANWLDGYVAILDQYLGEVPKEFNFEGKKYTPVTFAKEVLKFNADDYVSLTSFTHAPYYKPFILQVPDNFSNGSFYNLPLDDLLQVVKDAVTHGYSVMWDADVSNNGFRQMQGIALNLDQKMDYSKEAVTCDTKEAPADAATRQQLYESLTTQDDHLMHIVGIEKAKNGKTFFIVKNSWGKIGPFEGYINVSEDYMRINTVSIVIPKAALSKTVSERIF